MISIRNLGQKGDTIVEVLIAIAVVSSVLGIAYAIMGSNLQTMRDNQERNEASKIAQSQIELLRVARGTDAWDEVIAASTGSFCLFAPGSNPDDEVTVESIPPEGSGIPNLCSSINSSLYDVTFVSNGSGGYTVTVGWDSLGGSRGQVVMSYKFEGTSP